jgi:hypothetical protein
MPRNPSELARLEEELAFCEAAAYNLALSKSSREQYLRDVRRLQAVLGIEGKGYNHASKNELPPEIAERVDARIAEHRAHLAEMHKQYGRGTVPDERCIGIVLNFGDLLDLRAALNPKDTGR